MKKAPGKSHRIGISLIELYDMFPDELTAAKWFEDVRWPTDKNLDCPHCGSCNTMRKENRKPQPFRCRDCRKFFSVRTGSIMENSAIPLRKWAVAIYLNATSLKGVSSMKLHRDLKITQKSAWFLSHRLREAFSSETGLFAGPVEADETFIGGKRKNMSNNKRKELAGTGRGGVGKSIVVGAKDRDTNQVHAEVVEKADAQTLIPFVENHVEHGATVFTDEATAYSGLPTILNGIQHETVNHSISEYVNGQAHTNGVESFWALLKRGYHGTFHHMSAKHLHRYINEFSSRHNDRNSDTIEQMHHVVAGMIGKRLMYRDLVRGTAQ